MQKFLTSISTLLLLLSAVNLNAETTRYNVEIVIFEDTSDRYLDTEQWPVIHQAENELTSDILPPGLEPLPDSEPDTQTSDEHDIAIDPKKTEHPEINSVINITQNISNALSEHVSKLKRSSRYNVLLHQSWQQTGLDSTDAVSIKIDTSKIDDTENNNIKVLLTDQKTIDKNIKSSVQGNLKLVLGRYLHIHTDLIYKRLKNIHNQNTPALVRSIFDEFKIKSQRRMRSKELHYIDHPLLGILVLTSPIKSITPLNTDNSKVIPEKI